MKLAALAMFATGYVVGAKAGRERYDQIIAGAASASQRLEEFSSRRPPSAQRHGADRSDGDSRSLSTPF